MRIVAIYAVRNEARLMRRSIPHFIDQGLECYVIDNQSTDETVDVCRAYLGRGVIGIESFPFDGVCEWERILERKQEVCRQLGPGWYIHEDADQFREPPKPWRTLREAIEAADRDGYNAIDSDAFDFLPTSEDEDFDSDDFIERMRHYYYFPGPRPLHQLKIWKYFGQEFDIVMTGGHEAIFEGRRVFPARFVMRHYIALSKEQAIRKYCSRVYPDHEVELRQWHGTRVNLRPESLRFPERWRMKEVNADRFWDTSDPWPERYPLPPPRRA